MQDWPSRAIAQFSYSWAPSTLTSYNNCIKKLEQFCYDGNYHFPPMSSCVLAKFLCQCADGSARPQSILNTMQAALGHMYNAYNLDNLAASPDIKRLLIALVKSGTTAPRKRSTVMPTDSFAVLFRSWPENKILSMKDLRLKCVTLLSLYLMLRPSDIAPKSVLFDPSDHSVQNNMFTTDHVTFHDDGSATFMFLGVKNDLHRSGFKITLQPHSDHMLDGVSAIRCYIDRTQSIRQMCNSNAVFLSLVPPYHSLSASAIAGILNNAIQLAGLKDKGYSAKSFRPTGATIAVSQSVDPKIVQQVGRWKTTDIFYEHYVHSKPPNNFSDCIL